MKRDVRTRPGIRSRGEIIGVDLARYLEYGEGHGILELRAVKEPLAV